MIVQRLVPELSLVDVSSMSDSQQDHLVLRDCVYDPVDANSQGIGSFPPTLQSSSSVGILRECLRFTKDPDLVLSC